MATLQALLDRLDPDANRRGHQFERICRWYLENAPEYRNQVKRVWLWDEWPGRWGPDAGIDLVAETKSGELWAIQAKVYAADRTVTKRDVDTFLSESNRPQFSYRLLVATCRNIGKTAERTLSGQEKPAGRRLLGDLERDDMPWPETPEWLVAPTSTRKKPRRHQQTAINAVV